MFHITVEQTIQGSNVAIRFKAVLFRVLGPLDENPLRKRISAVELGLALVP
jgi:hypothetical protein